MAAARQLCQGRFLAGYLGRAEAATHRADQRWRDSFARHESGIQYALTAIKASLRRAARRLGRTRRERTNTVWRANYSSLKRGCCESKFMGRCKVTAIKRNGKWHVIEYNIRMA